MGDAKRKYNSFVIRLRKGLKRKFHSIATIIDIGFSNNQFVELFKELYNDDWQQLEKYFEYYNQKDEELLAELRNKKIQNPKPRYEFPTAYNFVIQTNYHLLLNIRKKHSINELLTEGDRQKLKKELLELSQKKHNKKLRQQTERTIGIQEVEPEYIDKLEQRLFNTDDLVERLNIVKEISKYKNDKTIQILYAVLAKEKDYFIRQMAFRNLQKFGQVVFLPKKQIGNKTKINRIETKFGEFKEDLGRTPDDVIRELNESTIQNFKAFDIFLSHSSKDLPAILSLVHEFNKQDLVVYVDWISDREDLKRTNLNINTAKVIRHRMNSSSTLVYAHSNNSRMSEWIYWEIGYFDALSKGICLYNLDDSVFQDIPIFLQTYPILTFEESAFFIQSSKNKLRFEEWIQIKN